MKMKLFASDLDGTLLGTLFQTHAFTAQWLRIHPDRRPLLVYNTGRMLEDSLQVIEEFQLPVPDYIISGVGTGIYDCRQKCPLKEFSAMLQKGWDRAAVDEVISRLELDLLKQPEELQNEYKSSWYLEHASIDQLAAIQRKLEAQGLEITLVYSSSRDLDILPKWADKGSALVWLLNQLQIRSEETLVAGDSGNDGAMFLIQGVKGIIVGNAQPELYQMTAHLPVYRAVGVCVDGVIEGLTYYGVLDGKGD